MALATVPSASRRSRRRWWWLVIPVAFALVAGIMAVRVVSCEASPEPFHGHEHFVESVTVGELDGMPVVVSGSRDGSIGVWELATGAAVRGPVDVDVRNTDILLSELAGRAVIVARTFDREIQVWDLDTVEPVGGPIGGDELPLDLAGVAGDGTVVTVVDGDPDYVRRWDLATGGPVGDPIGEDAGAELVSPRVGQIRGREVVAALDEEGTVRVWDLASGELAFAPFRTSATGSLAHLTLGELDGIPVLVTGSSGGFPETTIMAWDLDTGERIGRPLESRGYLASLEVGEVDGDPVIVAGHTDERENRDELTWVWDLASGEQLTEPFGFTPQWSWEDSLGINDQAITEFEGAPVVVVSHDSSIRVWDLRTGDLLVGDPGRLGRC